MSTEFLDRDGRPLRRLLVEDRQFAARCQLEDVSPHLVAAALSAEDKRFRRHCGIDFLASARALSDRLRNRERVSGASTITQQLVKLADSGPRTPLRKAVEIWLALRLELTWSKDAILTEYLNRLDYGNLQTGIASASRFYFGKPPADLSVAEAAFLAGLPKAPGRLDPHRNFAAARDRQHWILRRMRADGRLTGEGLERALFEPLKLRSSQRTFEAPHFVDLLLKRRGLIRPGPLTTTLDLELNRFVEGALTEQLRRIAAKNARGGAAVVIHNPTGDVLALTGSDDYFRPGSGEINGAWIVRSPGSALKPFTYLLALQTGANPCTVMADVPTAFPTPTGLYRPNNYNHRFYGPVSLRFALGNSLNVAAIRTLQGAGGPEALHRALRQCGITTLGHPPEYYGLGLTLGNGEVRLLELANAFATLGRLGIHRPYRLLSGDAAAHTAPRQVFDPRAAYFLAGMLSDNRARAASFGLESYLNFDFPVACKTGTSSDYRDNWTVGYTPEFTVAVWVGNPDGAPMRDITGVTGAAPLMHRIMNRLRDRHGVTWFEPPGDFLTCVVDPLTGRRVPPDRPGAVAEVCLYEPEPSAPEDYDGSGKVRLPVEYAEWLAGPQNSLGDLAVCAGSPPTLQILQPADGTVYYLDSDLPEDSQCIPLRAAAAGNIHWECPTLHSWKEPQGHLARLAEGRHRITARDEASGAAVSVAIEVKPW